MFHFSSSSCSRRSSPKGAMRRKRRSSSSLVLALLLWMTLSMLGRPACGQWQGYSDVSCDAPLGIDEAMLLLRGFRDLVDDNYPLSYLYQSTNCHGCDPMPLATLAHANGTACAKVSTKWPTRLLVTWTASPKTDPKATDSTVWSLERTVQFTEKATVSVEIVGGNTSERGGDPSDNDPYELSIKEAGGVATYRPLFYLLWVFLVLLFLSMLLQQLVKSGTIMLRLGVVLRYFPRPPPPVVAAEPSVDVYNAAAAPPLPPPPLPRRGHDDNGGVDAHLKHPAGDEQQTSSTSNNRGGDEGSWAPAPSSSSSAGLRRRTRQQPASVEKQPGERPEAQGHDGGGAKSSSSSSSKADKKPGQSSVVDDSEKGKKRVVTAAASGVVVGAESVVLTAASVKEGGRAEQHQQEQEQEQELDEEELLYREFLQAQGEEEGVDDDDDDGEEVGRGEQRLAQQQLEQQPQEPHQEEEEEEEQEEEQEEMTVALEEGRASIKSSSSTSNSSTHSSSKGGVQQQQPLLLTTPAAPGDATTDADGHDNEPFPTSSSSSPPSVTPIPRERALDVLRGLSVLGMVFVNYGGGGYALFEHSAWDGLAFADILFPTFVFISGAAAALSLRKLQRRLDLLLLQSPDQRRGKQLEEEEGDNDGPRSRSRYRQRQQQRRVARRVWAMKRAALWKVARRSAVLFALGLFLNNGYELSQWRVPGVLQYLAWCNLLIPALLILCMRAIPPPPSDDATRKGDEQQHQEWACRTTIQQRLQSLAATLLPSHCWWEPAIAALLLPALHLGLTYLLAAPGCPRGYVGPGGSMVASGSYQHCTGGAHGYLDRLLFSPHHILQTPPCGAVYETGAFDPEGIVGSLNAAFLFYLGVLAGRILTAPHFAPCPSPWKRPFLWLAGLALPLALLAYALGGSGLIPINKSLWSLSFVLATAAIDLGLLTGVYLLRSDATTIASPCAFVGRNALVVYVGHILLDDYFPFSLQVPAALEGTHGGALLVDVVGTGMWVLVAGFLHWRRVYIKV